MVPVLVMGNELTRAVMRASQLLDALTASEAGLRDKQARLQASHEQITNLFGRLIATQETERTRIARDLHDDVGQRIVCIGIAVSSLKRKLASGQEDATVAALTAMQRDLTALAEEIRQVSMPCIPASCSTRVWSRRWAAFSTEFETAQSIAVTFSAGDDIGHVEADTALCLYRITQEALHNVAKHADARRVAVTLMRTATGVQLSIADDGKGFDLAGTRGQNAGLGLVSIDERVRLLRGSVHIDTQPRRGTRMQIQIPRPPDNPPPNPASQRVTTLVPRSPARRSLGK